MASSIPNKRRLNLGDDSIVTRPDEVRTSADSPILRIVTTPDDTDRIRADIVKERLARLAIQRGYVTLSYDAAEALNKRRYGIELKATSEYIYANQKKDALAIMKLFYSGIRVVSVWKRTKYGADGLMIELSKLMATHEDPNFIVDCDNIRIITGMSNVSWETEMIKKSPDFLKNKVFHHGQLSKSELMDLKNAFIIIDEIDTGDKERQRLHRLLSDAGLLDAQYLVENNIRIMVISATIVRPLYQLSQWGNLHDLFKMTEPPGYIGHAEFLKRGVIQEWYPLTSTAVAGGWIQNDILDWFGGKYRVSIVRGNKKTLQFVQEACIVKGVLYKNHTSDEPLTPAQEKEYFIDPLPNHIVIGVKNLWSRADLFSDAQKIATGSIHERYVKKVDNNVQQQNLIGRMTGPGRYREFLDANPKYKMGIFRTSVKAIEEAEALYKDPYGSTDYQTAGYTKRNGVVRCKPTMLSPSNVRNLTAVELPYVDAHPNHGVTDVFATLKELETYLTSLLKVGRHTKYTMRLGNKITVRGVEVDIYQFVSPRQFKELDIYGGIEKDGKKTSCRKMPVFRNDGSIGWVGIYLKAATVSPPTPHPPPSTP